MKIGLRVKKDDNGKFLSVKDAFFEIGIGGGGIASALTTHEPNLSNHHSNFILEIEKMNCKCLETSETKILIKQATKEGNIEMENGGVFDASFPKSKTRRGRVQDCGVVCPTITAQNQEIYRVEKYRIRKLTPLECFRLMGVEDADSQKMIMINSSTQCYKQAGNSIVVDVMAAMFKQLF